MRKKRITDGLKDKYRQGIINVLSKHPQVEKAALFGSRATETFTLTSDVDLALFGAELSLSEQAKIAEEISEINIPQKVDLLLYQNITEPKLKAHIQKHGVLWYQKAQRQSRGAEGQRKKRAATAMKLGDFATINPKIQLEKGFEYSFVEMKDLEPSIRNVRAVQRKSFPGSGSKFEHGDTLLARITPCLENGKTSQFTSSDFSPAWGSTEFIVLRGKENISDSDFIFYFCRFPEFRNYAIQSMTGRSGRQRVPNDAVAEFEFSLPPLPTQKAIAQVLGVLDDKIELNRRTSATLEGIAKALFQAWFVDFEPVRAKMAGLSTGLPPEISRLFPAALVDSEIGKIPQGWRVDALDEIGVFKNGLALQKYPASAGEAKYPVVKIAQLRKGDTKGDNLLCSGVPEEFIINDGDFIFSWSGSLLAKYWVGGMGALNQHLFKVEEKNAPLWFVSNWVRHHMPEFQSIAAGKATTMGHIKREHLSQAKCVIAPKQIMGTAEALLIPIIERSILALKESRTLAKLRDALLPQLISGRLQIADAEKFLRDHDI